MEETLITINDINQIKFAEQQYTNLLIKNKEPKVTIIINKYQKYNK